MSSHAQANELPALPQDVEALLRARVAGELSLPLFPKMTDADARDVVEAVKATGSDSVLVTRMIRSETRRVTVEQPMWSMDTMDQMYQWAPGPQMTIEQDYQLSILETDLYDAKTAKIVWTGQSSSFPRANVSIATRELAARVISAIKDAKLF